MSVMTIDILSSSDDTRVLYKTFTTIAQSVGCSPTEGCSILTPRLLLDASTDYTGATHIYISEWGRYYYIGNIIVRTAKQIEISGEPDYLATYATALQDCPCVATRSESQGAPGAIPDKNLPIDPNRQGVYSILFDKDPFNTDTATAKCWQLITNGGEPL